MTARGLVAVIMLLPITRISASAQSGKPSAESHSDSEFVSGMRAFERDDYAGALRAWLPLAENGDWRAQVGVGALDDSGNGVEANQAEALKWYGKAVGRGGGIPEALIGSLYVAGGRGIQKDRVKAEVWLRKAADQGVEFAQLMVGLITVQSNPDEGLACLKRAVAAGDTSAAYEIGRIYLEGKFVPQNTEEGLRWFQHLAQGGGPYEQVWIGVTFFAGHFNVKQDRAEALRWYMRAAVQGDPEGQERAADSYYYGWGTEKNLFESAKWFKRAAEQGAWESMGNLGSMYENGEGVPQDYVQAYRWFNAAASSSNNPFSANDRNRRDRVRTKMTSGQVAVAQQLSAEWHPKPERSKRDTDLRLKLFSQMIQVSTQAQGQVGTERQAHEPLRTGTGFFVNGRGQFVTNHHVIDSCSSVTARAADGSTHTTTVVAHDETNDLAVLAIARKDGPFLVFSSGPGVQTGQSVIALGYPLHGILSDTANITTGIVSARAGILNDTRFVQITAPVQPGNSGGPLLDTSGNVVGVVSSKLNVAAIAQATGDIPQNIAFAIKASAVLGFLDAVGVEYTRRPSTTGLDPTMVWNQANKATVLVQCGE